uniref:FBD domain-containing protein n=1 Tax=Steinernema glaseri TaxID=37863 RepID=A0A1I7ZF66_9BILA
MSKGETFTLQKSESKPKVQKSTLRQPLEAGSCAGLHSTNQWTARVSPSHVLRTSIICISDESFLAFSRSIIEGKNRSSPIFVEFVLVRSFASSLRSNKFPFLMSLFIFSEALLWPRQPRDVDFLDVFVSSSDIGIKWSEDVAPGTDMRPKLVRIQGCLDADDGYFISLPTETVLKDTAELNVLASYAESLEMTVLASSMDLYSILGGFPTNFTFASISFLRSTSIPSEDLQTQPLYDYIGRLVASRNLRYFNLIGDDTNSCFDTLLLELLQQDQVKEVFVYLEHALKNEVVFLHHLLDTWNQKDPWKARVFAVSFFSPFEQLDFIRSLPQRASYTGRKSYYLSHHMNVEREVHIFRNEEGMLTLDFN